MAPAPMRESAAMVDLYADMFELAPVSLWLEDYSALKALFERWRAEGVRDLRAHLRRQTLAMFRASDKSTLLGALDRVFRDDMRTHFAEQLVDLWHGKLF